MVVTMRYHFPIAVDIYDFLYTGQTETHTNLILQLQSGVELIFEKCRGMQLASFRKQKASLPHWARETAS